MTKANKYGVSSETAKLLGRDKISWNEISWKNEEFFGINKHYIIHLLSYLQQKKYEEADDFFRKVCVLIKL